LGPGASFLFVGIPHTIRRAAGPVPDEDRGVAVGRHRPRGAAAHHAARVGSGPGPDAEGPTGSLGSLKYLVYLF